LIVVIFLNGKIIKNLNLLQLYKSDKK